MSAPHLETVSGWLSRTANRHRNDPALAGIDEAPVLSHGELLHFVTETGRQLNAAGIGCGDVVVLALPDGPMALAAFLGITSVAIACPVAAHEQPEEYARVLDETGARAVLMGDRPFAPLTQLADARGLTLLRVTSRPGAAAGVFDLSVSRPAAPRDPSVPTPDDDAVYCMTSGTSAAPKVVAWTHASLWTAAQSFSEWNHFTSRDRSLCMMPIAHGHSLVRTSLPVIMAGGSVIWTPGFDWHDVLAWIDQFSPTYMSAVPAIYRRMLERIRIAGWQPRPGVLRTLGIGSDQVDAATVEQLAGTFGAKIIEFYGLSETSPFVAATPAGGAAAPAGSVGRINPAWTVTCVDEHGAAVPPGEIGEIAVAGGIVNRIVGRSGRYSQRIDPQGRLRTGDLGRLDAHGFLYVDGRIDDVINRGGQKTHATAVEAAIASHPKVRKVVAFGVPDPVLGSRVAAAVVLHAGEQVTSDEILDHAAQGLKSYMVPERLFVTDQIPLNRVGKVSRKDLAAHFGAAATRRPTAGRTRMTESMVTLFRQLLRFDEVDAAADFFALGGDSISALDVLLEVEEQFGVSVPPATFARLSTPADLAAYVTERLHQDNVPRLVQAQSGNRAAPLIVAHGIDGTAGWATALARGMGPEASVTMLHARNPELREPETLAEMTRPYAALISRRLPGPYALTGHSMGAHVALAIAQHLAAQGASVPFLGVVDDDADVEKRLFGVAARPPDERTVPGHHRHALAISPAMPYRGSIVYFRADEDEAHYRSDPTGGWGEIALGGVRIVEVEGNHHSIVASPGLERLGPLVAAECHAALARPAPVVAEIDEMHRIRYDARLAARRGDLDEELRCYHRAIELDPEQPSWVHANLAEALFSAGQMRRGLDALDEALRRDSWPLTLDLRFGPYLLEQDLDDYLDRARRRAELLKSDHPSVLEQRGRLLLTIGDDLAAESLFRQGLDMAPQHLKLRTGLVDALRLQERFADAADVLAETVEQNPSIDWLQVYLARNYLDAGLPATGLEVLTRSRRTTEMWDGTVCKGRALVSLGRGAEAVALFAAVADREPGRAEPAFWVSYSLEQLGRLPEALVYARRAAACADAWPKLEERVELLAAALGRPA